MARTPDPPEPDPSDDVTIADEEWPVAEQYRVDPRRRQPVEDDRAIVIQQDNVPPGPVRRFPPDIGPGLLLALLGVLLIVALVPAGIWLAGRDDDESTASPTTGTVDTTTSTTATTQTTPTTPAARAVPELVGLTLKEARAQLERENVRVRVRRISSDTPAGEVLEQEPAPGARIARDTIVVLTVSKAPLPEPVTVPSVEGLLTSEATTLLRRAGLDVELETVSSSEPKGTVVGQNPAANEEVAPGTTVVLEVADPPEPPPAPATVEVPRLVGLRAAEARGQLRELGLRVTQRPVESTERKGTVVRQSPPAGTDLRKGQAVLLTVSTGPARVSVPDVVGLDEETARQDLEAAGFEVQVVDEPSESVDDDGIVLDQDPPGGSSRSRGSVVTITVSRFA